MLLLWIFLCRRQLHGTLLWIRQLPEMFLAMMRLFLPVSDGIKPVDAGKTAAAKPQSGGKTEKPQLNKGRKGWGRDKDSGFGEEQEVFC